MAKRTKQIVVSTDTESVTDQPVKVVATVAAVVCTILIGFLIWYVAIRDTWESKNSTRVAAELDEARRVEQSDPVKAYRIYDKLLKESADRSIRDEAFRQRLNEAQFAHKALHPKVEKQIRKEEALTQRKLKEEARLAAAEASRIADQERRRLAADEAERIADEKKKAAVRLLATRVSAYREATQAAETAVNALKRVEARTEVGINYADYSTVVGETWAELKIFVESGEGETLIELSDLMRKAVNDYKLALDLWRAKIQYPNLYGDNSDIDDLQQACWASASVQIEIAESLLDERTTATALQFAVVNEASEDDLDAKWQKIRKDALSN